jgi:spore maturation protein CgeB
MTEKRHKRLLFIHTEQYTAWQDELFFNLIRRPMLGCDLPLEVHDFVRNHRLDKSQLNLEQEGDDLLGTIKQFKPDMIIYSHSWYDVPNSSWEKIKKLNIPVFSILWDTLVQPAMSELNIIKYSDYIAVCNSVSNYFRYRLFFDLFRDERSQVLFGSGHHIVPEIFCYQPAEKLYDVTLLGSGEGQRLEIIKHLQQKSQNSNIRFYKLGGLVNSNLGSHEKGLTDGWMPLDEYVNVINQSKILICSQTRPERVQVKGKIFEFLSCKGFCLIDRNFEYESLIPEGCVAYFDSPDDLWNKIQYYNSHDAEREKIAEAGHRWYVENFDYKKHWGDVIAYITGTGNEFPCIPTLAKVYTNLKSKELEHFNHGIMSQAASIIQNYSSDTGSKTAYDAGSMTHLSTKTLARLLVRRVAGFVIRRLQKLQPARG